MEFWILAAGLTSLALGGVMTILAAHVMQQHHRREVARTALLSQMAFPGGAPQDAVPEPLADADAWDQIDAPPRESSVATDTLFHEPEPSGAASRLRVAVASVSVIFAIFAAAYWWSATVHTASRVELLSLTDRATPDAFLVAGRVHNPAGGAPLRDVVAVVDVMDGAGRVLMTVRAPIQQRELHAGEYSEFSATASKARDVAAYRVTFQDAARAAVPHVDRRQQPANSTSG
jgi:hypothetical protein